jgi:hypothetical protein
VSGRERCSSGRHGRGERASRDGSGRGGADRDAAGRGSGRGRGAVDGPAPSAPIGDSGLVSGSAPTGGSGLVSGLVSSFADLVPCLALAAALVTTGCGRPSGPPAAAPSEAAPAWRVRPGGGQLPIDPGIDVGPGGATPEQLALLDAESCRGCHAAEHAEWAGSRHGAAWTNGIFQREYSAEPRAWCVNCHAPLTVQQAGLAAGDSRLADQGVSCAACHVRGGALVARRKSARSPHATIADTTFGSPAMCADCHQFTFPVLSPRDGAALRFTEHPMQSTVSDFLAGPYGRAPDGCLTCHATAAGHGFPGGHDLDMLQAAVSASWCLAPREAPGGAVEGATSGAASASAPGVQVVIEVANRGAGHRVPTGDIHRHMVARLWRSSAPESTFEAFFGRRYEPAPDGGKRITWDSSLAPGQRRRFAVPERSLHPSPPPLPPPSAGAVEAEDLSSAETAAERAERREAEAAEAAEAAAAAAGEPLNFEVVYIYTLDEFPRRDRIPSEPVRVTLVSERKRLDELPRCATAPPPSTAAATR